MSGFEIVKPESVLHAEKQAAKQIQLERRGIARELLQGMAQRDHLTDSKVDVALEIADYLLSKTKVDP